MRCSSCPVFKNRIRFLAVVQQRVDTCARKRILVNNSAVDQHVIANVCSNNMSTNWNVGSGEHHSKLPVRQVLVMAENRLVVEALVS
jgi:hypothetical protein